MQLDMSFLFFIQISDLSVKIGDISGDRSLKTSGHPDCIGNASERTGRQSHDQALQNMKLCTLLNISNICLPQHTRCVCSLLYPLRAASWWERHGHNAGPMQAYSTLAFLSSDYRNTGEPTAGEPVIVSTCRILTASRGGKKLKDRRSFAVKSSAVPPGKLRCCFMF